MEDGESRSRGNVVAKATNLSEPLIKETVIRLTAEVDDEGESTSRPKPSGNADGKIVALARQKKTPCKSELMAQIGVGLRGVYDDVVAQPVPDRFFELLRQLESSSVAQSKKDIT
jgi:hypothetical protein